MGGGSWTAGGGALGGGPMEAKPQAQEETRLGFLEQACPSADAAAREFPCCTFPNKLAFKRKEEFGPVFSRPLVRFSCSRIARERCSFCAPWSELVSGSHWDPHPSGAVPLSTSLLGLASWSGNGFSEAWRCQGVSLSVQCICPSLLFVVQSVSCV